jgi:tRNA threonylcarbamoyladenosine biosynthesis protein TsaE
LQGELGGGKTTFLQGFAKGLGIRAKVLSPTFIILKKFKISTSNLEPRTSNFKYFYHVDCYRIKNKREILDLGFKEIVSDPKNIVAVEWSNYILSILPPKTTFITFKVVDESKRSIIIKS